MNILAFVAFVLFVLASSSFIWNLLSVAADALLYLSQIMLVAAMKEGEASYNFTKRIQAITLAFTYMMGYIFYHA